MQYGLFFTLLSVAIGWIVVHKLSEQRERRKEVRALLDKLMERLKVLEKDVICFHTHPTFDYSKSREITSEMDRIETKVTRIPYFNQDDLVPTLIAYRQSITSKNFDKSSFQTLAQDSELIENIREQSLDFEDALEVQYAIAYPIKFKISDLWLR